VQVVAVVAVFEGVGGGFQGRGGGGVEVVEEGGESHAHFEGVGHGGVGGEFGSGGRFMEKFRKVEEGEGYSYVSLRRYLEPAKE